MEMEDHDHHNQQFGIDLRQFIGGRPAAHFPAAIPQPPPAATAAELFSGHRNHHSHHHHQQQQQQQQLQPPQAHHHYDMMMQLIPRDGGLHDFRAAASSINACVAAAAAATPCGGVSNANHSASTTVAASSTPPTLSGLEAEAAGSFGGGGGGDGGTGRWPRQETLTLLEIRSRLDSKFKEANQKGPLWDEVSRIMTEEHGYQRSGKKCREKFENLYKYYKKTKEGKAGRQDGKHYRFFRQLEALYGETSNPISVPESHLVGNGLRLQSAGYTSTQANQEIFHSQKLCDSLSLSNSSEFDTSSSEDNDLSTATAVENDSTEKRRRRRGGSSWKAKIKDFIDSQMRKLMERQEAWLEKLTKTLEEKEQERMLREDAWRKQEAARMDKEHKFWEKKRAWIESRDAAIMEALRKLTGREVIVSSSEELVGAAETHHNQSEDQNDNGNDHTISNNVKFDNWPESEITRLIQLRTSMDSKFQRSGCLEEVLWEEIAAKMGSLGYDRSAMMCRDKWDCLNVSPRKTTETHSKKRKENSRNSYFQSNESIYNQGPAAYCEISEHGPETVVRTQSNDGSSPANSNAGNAVNDSCFRFLIGDGESLWENYGLKLNRDQNQ